MTMTTPTTTTKCKNCSLIFLFALLSCLILLYSSPYNQSFNLSALIRLPFAKISSSAAYDHHSLVKNYTSVERIEGELAKVRKSIKDAITLRKSTSYHKNTTFIPRGNVYRNPYAFHQSHSEMERRFKVWVYREGDSPLFHEGPVQNIYGIEGQFIDELMHAGKSRFLARHPDEAHTFFLPISITNIRLLIYKPLVTYSRLQLQNVVTDYIKVIAHKHPYWNRSNGADHFFLSCYDWAPDISKADPTLYKNFMRSLCNANRSEGFEPQRDISIPEINIPVGKLNPSTTSAQPPSRRPILGFFAGGSHGYIRNVLLNHWKDKEDEMQVHEYLDKNEDYLVLMGQSKFCLCPSGFEVASPRVVEAIQLGCVPVIISDNYTLPFSDVLDWSKFSITIPTSKIAEIKEILTGVSQRKYEKLYRGVVKVQRHFTLNRPSLPYDMIHMVLHSVWLRRLNFMLQ